MRGFECPHMLTQGIEVYVQVDHKWQLEEAPESVAVVMCYSCFQTSLSQGFHSLRRSAQLKAFSLKTTFRKELEGDHFSVNQGEPPSVE